MNSVRLVNKLIYVQQGIQTWAIKCTTPHTVNLCMLHLMGRAPHIYRTAGRCVAQWLEKCGEENILHLLPVEPSFLIRPAHTLVTILTEIF